LSTTDTRLICLATLENSYHKFNLGVTSRSAQSPTHPNHAFSRFYGTHPSTLERGVIMQ